MNVGAVDQTVTFAKHQNSAAVSVPILAGAANPGEVDVTLTATPINPPIAIGSASLVLRILASDASVPPQIIAEQGTPEGIVLAFNKPMDPAAASNVHNYTVCAKATRVKTSALWAPYNYLTQPIRIAANEIGDSISVSTHNVPLRAAQYDPATNSVTLIPKRRLTYAAAITVTRGPG